MGSRLVKGIIVCAVVAAAGQDATLVFYEDFSDGLQGWDADGFTILSAPYRSNPAAYGMVDQYGGCNLRRWFDALEGWVLCRYDCKGIDVGYDYFALGYNTGMLGLHFGSDLRDTMKSFAVAGNFWRYGGSRLPMACTVHRYTGDGGYVAFHAPALPPGCGAHPLLDNICLYLLDSACKLDSSDYTHDIGVTRPDTQWGNFSFAVTYRGIPMRGRNTLLVHLAVSDTARRVHAAYYVNDSAVGCPFEPFLDYDEVSFGWQPGTDTVNLTFKGMRDSVVFSARELTIFTLDLDTAADPRAARVRAPQGATVRIEPLAPGPVAVFDVKGRRVVPTEAYSRGVSGVYLRSDSPGRRVRPTVRGIAW